MYCNHCGAEIKDGSKFCVKCGSPVAAEQTAEVNPSDVNAAEQVNICDEQYTEPTPVSAPTAEPVYAAAPAPIPTPVKKKSKTGIVVAVVAVITALAVAAGVFLVPRFLKKDPKDQFAALAKASFKSINSSFTNERTTYDKGANVVANIDVSKDFLSLLDTENLNLGIDKDIVLTADYTVTNNAQLLLTASADGKSFLQLNTVIDMMAKKAYLSVPDVLSGTFEADIEEIIDSFSSGMKLTSDSGVTTDFADINDLLPDGKTAEQMFDEYFDIFINGVENIESEEGTLEIGNLSEKCTVLTATVSEKEMSRIVVKILEKARDDKRVSDVVCVLADITEDEYKQNVDDAIESIKDGDTSSDEELTVKLYANSKDELVSIEIALDTFKMAFGNIETKDAWSSELSVKTDENTIKASGSGTIGGGKRNGNITISYNKEDVLYLEIENAYLKDGKIFGTYEMSLGDGFFDLFGNGIDISSKTLLKTFSARAEIKEPTGDLIGYADISIKMGSTRLFGVELEVKSADNEIINVPEKGDYTDIEEWAATLDFEALYGALSDAGFPVDQWLNAYLQNMYY